MGDIEQPPYDMRDGWVIPNNIFHELCELDADDRQADNDPAWNDLEVLVKKRLGAYHINEDNLFPVADFPLSEPFQQLQRRNLD